MSTSPKDPTAAMRLKASRYPGVDEGTACTQSSFKTGKKAFLFVGMQGGRHKAMFKLDKSIPEATRMAKGDPDLYQVGSSAWVTARFRPEKPLPKKIWERWLDESYQLSAGGGARKTSVRKKAAKKKAAKKKAAPRKKAAKNPAAKKKAAKKKAAPKKKTRSRTRQS